jgi:23S rRNA (cytidine2498-2'-O)-methyltransferase
LNPPASTPASPAFLFVTCQAGAETPLKQLLARRWPEFRFAYSRPGFLTFKLPPEHALAEDFDLECPLARAYGFSLGAAEGATPEARAGEVWRLAAGREVARLHVWPRDERAAGDHGYEPGHTEASRAVEAALRAAAPSAVADVTAPRAGDRVLDVIVVEPDHWWVGVHCHGPGHLPWPGGLSSLELPPHAVSRAYLKASEALAWSGMELSRGDVCAELGASPGGASQALLDRGLSVLGIDPAVIDPAVLANPKFTHLRKRSHEVRRREFRKVRWLLADMNVAPQYTLDSVEEIVQHPETNIRGLLLTLKLPEWKLVEDLPAWVERVRGWGYPQVAVQQLGHHRQELALAAQRGDRRR